MYKSAIIKSRIETNYTARRDTVSFSVQQQANDKGTGLFHLTFVSAESQRARCPGSKTVLFREVLLSAQSPKTIAKGH